jgi:hypothetical protein
MMNTQQLAEDRLAGSPARGLAQTLFIMGRYNERSFNQVLIEGSTAVDTDGGIAFFGVNLSGNGTTRNKKYQRRKS